MLSFLLTAAIAAEPVDAAQPVEPAYVLVDRNAWLYAGPDQAGPRLHADEVVSAPEYRQSPVVILMQREVQGDMLRVRVVTSPPNLGTDGQIRAPDVVPSTWRHCYPQAAGLSQLGIDVWVRQADLLPVLQREVTVQTPAGDRAVLSPGLAAIGSDGIYRVLTHHLSLVVPLPDDAVAQTYPLDTPPVGEQPLVAQRTGGSDYVQPTWEAHLDLRGDSLSARLPRSRRAEPARALKERCVAFVPASPLPQVPRRDLSELRAASTSPISFPMGTVLATTDGSPIGEVAGGGLILWSRRDCAWKGSDQGMCCTDLDGVVFDRHAGICLQAELPPIGANMDYQKLLMMRATDIADRASRSANRSPRVSWDAPAVDGQVELAPVQAGLEAERETLAYCFNRAIGRNPDAAGTITVRFALAPDGRGRSAVVLDEDLRDAALTDCVVRVAERIFVPAQVGAVATIVTWRIRFDTVPKDG